MATKTNEIKARYQRGELNAQQAQLELLAILIESIDELAAQIKPKPRKGRKPRGSSHGAIRTDEPPRS